VSAAKSAAMVFGGRLQRSPTLRICGDAVPLVAQHWVLGVVLDRGLSLQAHLTTACDKALKMIYRIALVAKRQFGIRPSSLHVIYSGVFLGELCYASGAWAHRLIQNKRLASKVSGAQRKALCRLYGLYTTVSAAAAQVATAVLPVDLVAKKLAASFFLKRGEEDRARALVPGLEHGLETFVWGLWEDYWRTNDRDTIARLFFPTVELRRRSVPGRPGIHDRARPLQCETANLVLTPHRSLRMSKSTDREACHL